MFNGSIAEVLPYLDPGIFVFADIRDLLDRQFDRLSENEQTTLFWFAIHREPVSIADIRENVVDLASGQSVPNLINSLIRRSLSEKTYGLFFLQPVVMEYVTEQFIQQVCTEFETQQLDVLQSHALVQVQAKDYVREIQAALAQGDRYMNADTAIMVRVALAKPVQSTLALFPAPFPKSSSTIGKLLIATSPLSASSTTFDRNLV